MLNGDNDFENDQNEEVVVPGSMETRTRVFLDTGEELENPLVDKIERTGVGPGGLEESVDIRLSRASGCQHVIHTGAEVGGVCSNPSCRKVLCAACSHDESVCFSCRLTICGTCQKKPFLRDEEGVLCPRCAARWWLKNLFLAGFFSALAFIFLVAISRM